MFFFSCSVLGCLLLSFIVLSCLLFCCTVLLFFFIRFYRSWFSSPAINQISHSQSKSWFSFILLFRWEKYHWTGLMGLRINYSIMISELYQDMYSYNSSKNHELWKMSIVLSTCQLRTTYYLPTQTIFALRK